MNIILEYQMKQQCLNLFGLADGFYWILNTSTTLVDLPLLASYG